MKNLSFFKIYKINTKVCLPGFTDLAYSTPTQTANVMAIQGEEDIGQSLFLIYTKLLGCTYAFLFVIYWWWFHSLHILA